MEILYMVIGLLAGIVIAIILYFSQRSRIQQLKKDALEAEKNHIAARAELQNEAGITRDRLAHAGTEIEKLNTLLAEEQQQKKHFQIENTRLQADYANLHQRLEEHKKETAQLQEKLKTEFENLASQIMKKNTEDISNYNRERLEETLKPFKDKMQDFEKKVSETYEKSLKDTTALKTEVKQLYELNRRLSEEAGNLTRALKGDVKKQGNWGEVILERILERSGLRKGSEYEVQMTAYDEEGRLIRPDVIIRLPDKKHLIVDSKVSLVAYEQLVNCENDEERKKLAKAHVDSVRNHIRLLSGKHYHTSKQFNSPDFVLLFVPIEASFSLAVQEDSDLFSFAWDSKIVIVSPSTLLATLLTIASMWKQENQTRNAMEIARQTGALYDKFVLFLESMEKIEKSLESAQKAYAEAMNRMKTGTGNLIISVEKVRKLGIKTNKSIPEQLIEEQPESAEAENEDV